jgi:hypothetical protein
VEMVVMRRKYENIKRKGSLFISKSYEKPSMNNCNPQINEEAVSTTAIKGVASSTGGRKNQGRLNRKI